MPCARACLMLPLLLLAATAAADDAAWISLGPPGGDVVAVTIDPLNPSVLYVGTGAGGVFKSTDGGARWRTINAGLRGMRGGKIVVDPMNPSTLYVASSGVLKSTDGGASWMPADSDIDRQGAGVLVLDPTNPSNVYYAPLGAGVFKSTDGAVTWTSGGLGSGVRSLAIDPLSPSNLYAGTSISGIYKTTNGARSWFGVFSHGRQSPIVYGLAVDPEDPLIVYALAVEPQVDEHGDPADVYYLLRTTDGGNTWSESYYRASVNQVTFDPTTSAIVFLASDSGLYKSTDRGETRSLLGGPVRMTDVAVHPRSTATLFAAVRNGYRSGFGGLYKSTDGGLSFEEASGNIHAATIREVAVDPLDRRTIYVVTEMGSLHKTTDRGASWARLARELDPALTGAVDPFLPGYVYLVADHIRGPGGLYRSTDGGESWRAMTVGLASTGGGRDILSMVFDPTGAIYLATRGGVYRSVNRGALWTSQNEGLPLPGALYDPVVAALGVSASDPDVLYGAIVRDGFYKSTDGAETWTYLTDAFDKRDVRALRVDPTNPAIVYAATDEGVFKSVNGGAFFVALNTGLPDLEIEDLAIDPSAPRTVYAATQTAGVFQSLDGGANWDLYGGRDDLGNPNTRTVTLDPSNPGTVYVGTWGSGLFVRSPSACQDSDTVLCLNRQRFQVEVSWRDFQGATGSGTVVPANSDDSGLFWFFTPDNWEMLVKVLDGCAVNGRYWVFSAATTNVRLTLRVTDTETGSVKEYVNPLGTAADAVTDTSAFATCP